ncbi:MAG: cache domain-containing protein [Pseudomonadota bacterium]
MRSLSITFKVFGALTVCIAAAAAGFVWLTERSYEANVQSVANQALATAQRTFRNVQASETSKLGATLTSLMADDRMRELYVQRDRAGLLDYAQPVYAKLKSRYAVTNWHFMDVEPEMFVFLRLHDPANHSEVFSHQTALDAIHSRSMASGMELGKFGFALRVVSPYKDKRGALVGYMEVAEDIARFAATMKAQTGDDYALVANKALLDRSSYETSMVRRHERNAWSDLEAGLVLGATSSKPELVRFDGGNLANVAASGQFLEQRHEADQVWVRGAFPLVDVRNTTIGAVFVQHEITTLHRELLSARNSALMTIGLLLVLLTVTMAIILRKLVFLRIERTMAAATRVVGGDFESPIVTTSEDEVGRLEMLLESFRKVFVSTVTDYERLLVTTATFPAGIASTPASEAAEPEPSNHPNSHAAAGGSA